MTPGCGVSVTPGTLTTRPRNTVAQVKAVSI